MNPHVAPIVAIGLLVYSVSFAAGPSGHLNPADGGQSLVLPEENVTAAAGSVTCTFGDFTVTVNEADQSAHTGGDFCTDWNLTGTVKRATPKKVKASNLDGDTDNPQCCEAMHIDLIKYSKRKGVGKMKYSFVCNGGPVGPFTLEQGLTCH
jgi:hypothetical protein